ncbi:MAG: Hpt domain-containing protein, partial [Thermodesulfovibrio sp.]|nr:Hpt domain-containing protein [Thermodesulfovibrio sp.]
MKNPILEQFILESRDYLQRVGEILIKLEEEQSKDLLNELFRIVHTLKGNSGLFNFSAMTKLLHASEDLMNSLRDETISYSSHIADILLESMDIVSQMIDEVEAYGEPQLSTNERAQEKALLIREILSEKKQIETSEVLKLTSEEKTSKHYDYLVIPEEFRIKIVKAFFEGKNPIIVKYMPEEECFYKGEDPLFYVRKIPETIWSRFYLREKIEDIATFDIYRCITNFEAVTTADEETLKEHFKYILDQIEFIKPEIVSFIVPHGDKNGGPVYEDFVLDFRELLKSESIDILKNSLRALKELTSPTLFVASCLRWIEALIDYIPKSTPYIEALLRSIETLEPPMFDKIMETKKSEVEEIKVEKPIKTLEIPAELFRVFEEQRKVLEKIKDKDENIRRNTISSIILSLENAIKSLKNEELLEKFKREVKEENLETILSFIDEFIKEEKIITEEAKQLTETQTVKTQKEERIIYKSEEPTTAKFLKVDEEKVNRLMNLIGELVVAKNSLLYLSKKVEREYGIAS